MAQREGVKTTDTGPASPPRPAYLPVVLGTALMALGLVVMTGWLLHIRQMVEFRTGMVAMTFNTALCFTLAGAAIALPAGRRSPMPAFQNGSGIFLLTLGALVLVEHCFDRSLGIDWAFLHTWLQDGNVRPGRLAPNTAIGFMLVGACLVLMQRIASKKQEWLYQTLVFCVLAVGLTGLLGYIMAPDLLFGWARSARMAVPTAVGMIALAGALWGSWNWSRGARRTRYFGMDERIGFMSTAILCLATFTAGLTGFVFQQSVLENSLRDRLQFRLEGQRGAIQAALSQARAASARAAGDPQLLAAARALVAAPRQGAALARVAQDLETLVRTGFHSASLYAPDGTLLRHSGPAVTLDPDKALPLPDMAGEQASLAWHGQLLMHTSMPLLHRGRPFARLALAQDMAPVQAQLLDLRGIGKSGEVLMCASRRQQLVCLPSARKPAVYVLARRNMAGLPYPMSLAIDGEAGLAPAIDYWGNTVLAAYAPVAPKLGLVVKQDAAELFLVIRRQLTFLVPSLLLLLVLGAVLMRLQLKPLVARLIASETRAREKHLETDTVVASVGEGIVTLDQHGIVESFNAAACRIFGYRADEVIGRHFGMLIPPDAGQALEAGMKKYLATGEPTFIGNPNVELPGLRKGGLPITLELTVNDIKLDKRVLFVGVVRDISERKLVQEKLVQLAQYDVLTGLPNRALFMDRLAIATARAIRNDSALAVLFLDLDGFKGINDSLGHHAGDELLKAFGARLTAAVRKCDTVARLGGDEFTIILEELQDAGQDARAVADKIVAGMAQPFELTAGSVTLSTSIGVAIHDGAGASVDDLLRRSDDAMYRAKHCGKNRWST